MATAAVNIKALIACLVNFIGLNSLLLCPTGEIEELAALATAGVKELFSLFCALDALFIDPELKALPKTNNRGEPQSWTPFMY